MTREQINDFNNPRSIIGLTGCAFGLGLMVFGLAAGSSSNEPVTNIVKQESTKKLPTWNIALGDVVILARDMGFSVKASGETPLDETKVAGRIESQLQSLRELYREQTSKQPALMGGIVLQLTISPTGEVAKVREIPSRLDDSEFRKGVIAEASTWSFDPVLSEEWVITCPLLFVREGMEVTTLLQWEKNLSQAGDKPNLSKFNMSVGPTPRFAAVKNPVGREAPPKEVAVALPQPVAQANAQSAPEAALYQIKHSTVIRKEPNPSADAVARFSAGTKVVLVGKSGDWYEVRYDGGPKGFLRKEFITPVSSAKSKS
jgi:Bacterial SH3 domain